MYVTILEALQNAEYNLKNDTIGAQKQIGLTQLHNAVELLDKGYNPSEEVEPLILKYGSLEKVPDKE